MVVMNMTACLSTSLYRTYRTTGIRIRCCLSMMSMSVCKRRECHKCSCQYTHSGSPHDLSAPHVLNSSYHSYFIYHYTNESSQNATFFFLKSLELSCCPPSRQYISLRISCPVTPAGQEDQEAPELSCCSPQRISPKPPRSPRPGGL